MVWFAASIGWEKYKQLTEAKSEKIKAIIENEELDIEEVVEKLERIESKVKFEAFGKTSRKVKVPKKDVPRKDGENAEKARELKDSVFLLCKRIIESESVPKKFRDSMLHQIW